MAERQLEAAGGSAMFAAESCVATDCIDVCGGRQSLPKR